MTCVHTHNEVLGSKQFPASGVVQKVIKPLKNSTNNNVTNKFCISSGIFQFYFLEHPVACSLTPANGGNVGQNNTSVGEKGRGGAKMGMPRSPPFFSVLYLRRPLFCHLLSCIRASFKSSVLDPHEERKETGGEENTERRHFLAEEEDKERKWHLSEDDLPHKLGS